MGRAERADYDNVVGSFFLAERGKLWHLSQLMDKRFLHLFVG